MIIFYSSAAAVLLGGLGLIGAIGIGFPFWAMTKLGLWLAAIGFQIYLIKMFPKLKPIAAELYLVLLGLAVYIVIFRPY